MLLNNKWVNKEIKEEIKRYLETNENNTTAPNLRDMMKAVLRGKFMELRVYLKNQEKSQINNLILCLNKLEKEQQTKPKLNIRKEIKISQQK